MYRLFEWNHSFWIHSVDIMTEYILPFRLISFTDIPPCLTSVGQLLKKFLNNTDLVLCINETLYMTI